MNRQIEGDSMLLGLYKPLWLTSPITESLVREGNNIMGFERPDTELVAESIN